MHRKSGLGDSSIKFLKRSLIVKFFKHELSTASLQFSTGKVILRLQTGSRKLNKF